MIRLGLSLGLSGKQFKQSEVLSPTGVTVDALAYEHTFADVAVPESQAVEAASYDYTFGDVTLTEGVTEPYALDGWKLTLPWDSSETYTGSADEILQPELLTYESLWFARSDVFDYTCPEGGATTATATYARCELRHLTDQAWDSQTEMKLVWEDVDMPDGEKTVVFQTHDAADPEFKIVYTGAGPTNSDGLLRILYKATEGAGDTTVVLDSAISRGDTNYIRIRRYPDQLQVFLGANVDGATPDWSSNDDTAFSRDGTNGTYFWKMGNYLQIDNPPYTDTPAYTIRHHPGTWDNPVAISTTSVTVGTMAFEHTFAAVTLPDVSGGAAPVAESSAQGTSSSGTVTVTAPTGITDGDLLLLAVSQDNAGASDPFTPPSGFTSITGYDQQTGVGLNIYYKIASSESGDYSITESNSNVTNAVMVRVSGANGTPVDVETSSVSSGDPAVGPDVTTTVDNTLVFRIASWDASKTLSLAPSGVTADQHVDVSGHDLWVGHEEQATAGAVGTVDWDLSASTVWVCATIAIAPA